MLRQTAGVTPFRGSHRGHPAHFGSWTPGKTLEQSSPVMNFKVNFKVWGGVRFHHQVCDGLNRSRAALEEKQSVS